MGEEGGGPGVGRVMNMSPRHPMRPLMSNSAALGKIKYFQNKDIFTWDIFQLRE